jgi:hypothetical protein
VLQHLTGGKPQISKWSSAHVSGRSKDQLWWLLKEATRLLAPVIASRAEDIGADSHPQSDETVAFGSVDTNSDTSSKENWRDGVVVLCVAEYDKSQELAALDPYMRMRERRLRAQNLFVEDEPIRLVKLRSVFPKSEKDKRGAGSLWSRSSPLWTDFAKRDLQYDPAADGINDETESIVWWATLDEFAAAYDTLLVMKCVQGADIQAQLHRISPSQSRDLVALEAPHYLLSVAKTDDAGTGNDGDDGDAVNSRFPTIHALKVPPIDFGAESEDENEFGTASQNSKSSLAETDTVRPNGLRLEMRLSLPPIEHHKAFKVQLFRVPGPEKVKPVRVMRDAVVSYQFPTFGRIEARPVSSTVSKKELTLFFEADLVVGFYNLVVCVDIEHTGVTDGIATDTPLEVSCTARNNGELFSVSFEPLP